MNSVWRWTLCALAVGLVLAAGCGAPTECADYLPAKIAQLRQAQGSGCFELKHVVLVARTPSSSAPRLYLQDAEGGEYSALMAKCDAGSSHACPNSTAENVAQLIDGEAITARGYYHQGSRSGFEELYLDAVIDEGKVAALPEPAQLTVAELARTARVPAKWFQMVTAQIAVEDPLVMYDFSPAEFALHGPCPAWSGFGVIPFSALGSAPPARGCEGDAGTENPVGATAPDAREILVGRQFFKEFLASADCACAAASKQHKLSASSAVLGPTLIRGVLILELQAGSSRAYQVFEPTAKGFPITLR